MVLFSGRRLTAARNDLRPQTAEWSVFRRSAICGPVSLRRYSYTPQLGLICLKPALFSLIPFFLPFN